MKIATLRYSGKVKRKYCATCVVYPEIVYQMVRYWENGIFAMFTQIHVHAIGANRVKNLISIRCLEITPYRVKYQLTAL